MNTYIGDDIKLRYIKIKGKATPQRISDLEDLFEIHRNNTKIRQQEAGRLNKEAEEIKGKIEGHCRVVNRNRSTEGCLLIANMVSQCRIRYFFT